MKKKITNTCGVLMGMKKIKPTATECAMSLRTPEHLAAMKSLEDLMFNIFLEPYLALLRKQIELESRKRVKPKRPKC
jgi:hypothetical protein